MRLGFWLLGICFALGMLACTSTNPAYEEPEKCVDGESAYSQTFALTHSEMVDVLLVVGNSLEHEALIEAMRDASEAFIAALGDLDYRIWVVAADGSGAPVNTCYLGSNVSSTVEDPAQVLNCLLAEVPLVANAPPQLLDSAIAAAQRPGLLRPQARLLVFSLSLYDDCSSSGAVTQLDACANAPLSSVHTLYSAMRLLKEDLNGLAFAFIGGGSAQSPSQYSCDGVAGRVFSAPRLWELQGRFGTWAEGYSACTDDLTAAVQAALRDLAFASEARYCLWRNTTRAPRSVELMDGSSALYTLNPEGGGGYAYLGATPECESGVITVNYEVRTNVQADSAVKVIYCGSK